MSTFAALKTAISKRLIDANNSAVSAADVGDAINNTIDYWKTYRFWFNEARDSATLTVGDGTIPLPSNFLMPVSEYDGFEIEYSNTRFPLMKVTAEQYNNVFYSSGQGLPQIYANLAGAYECYPLPDIAYTVNRRYLKNYTALSGDSDTNDFTVYAPRLVQLWTLADLMAEFMQDDKMESYYRNRANEEFTQLTLRSNKANGSGSLDISSYLM